MVVQLDRMFESLVVRRDAIPATVQEHWARGPAHERSRSVSNALIRMSFMGAEDYDDVVAQMEAAGLSRWRGDGSVGDFVLLPVTGKLPAPCDWLDTGSFELLNESTVARSHGYCRGAVYVWPKGQLPASVPMPDLAHQREVVCRVVPGSIQLVNGDITKIRADAIVNAANRTLLGGGGVDGAIHRAAGRALLEECRGLGGCEVGQVKTTQAYQLPARWVLHTVGPIWSDADADEAGLLAACYRNALTEATRLGARSVAFPCISTGVYRYPSEEAAAVAVATVRDYLCQTGAALDVIFCCLATLDCSLYGDLLGRQSGVCNEIGAFISYREERQAVLERKRQMRALRKGGGAAGPAPEAGDWTLAPM